MVLRRAHAKDDLTSFISCRTFQVCSDQIVLVLFSDVWVLSFCSNSFNLWDEDKRGSLLNSCRDQWTLSGSLCLESFQGFGFGFLFSLIKVHSVLLRRKKEEKKMGHVGLSPDILGLFSKDNHPLYSSCHLHLLPLRLSWAFSMAVAIVICNQED